MPPGSHLGFLRGRVLIGIGALVVLGLFFLVPFRTLDAGMDLPDEVDFNYHIRPILSDNCFLCHGPDVSTREAELLPYTAQIVDELCFINSMYTEAINHDPAITFFQTGSQQTGRPSIGSWLSYGLGSENSNLPTFCVLLSRSNDFDQPLYSRLWGNGFLPSLHQGVQFRSGKDPVLYLNNPPGIKHTTRRRMLDNLRELHQRQHERVMDPEINSRIAQYEMAYRMQTSVPVTMDVSEEPDHVFDLFSGMPVSLTGCADMR